MSPVSKVSQATAAANEKEWHTQPNISSHGISLLSKVANPPRSPAITFVLCDAKQIMLVKGIPALENSATITAFNPSAVLSETTGIEKNSSVTLFFYWKSNVLL